MTLAKATLPVLCLAALLLAGCLARSSEPYPEPETRQMALDKRDEFVEAFLRGRWCEAQSLFLSSTVDYLRQDDFCAAAYTYHLAWRLTAYLGVPDDSMRRRADRLAKLGLDCGPDLGDKDGEFVGPRDEAWDPLVRDGRFDALLSKVQSEKDALYASVYGRKGARAAIRRGQNDQARRLLEAVHRRDADLGWLLFIIEDWKLLAELEPDPARKQLIQERIERLEGLIEPCRATPSEGERP